MTDKNDKSIPTYLKRARLDAELLALRVERQTLPMSAIVRKMQVGARMLAIRDELANLRQGGRGERLRIGRAADCWRQGTTIRKDDPLRDCG